MTIIGNIESGSAAEAADAWLQQFYEINPVTGEIIDPDFATVQAAALVLVQQEAESARGLVITLQPGKIGAYVQKQGEVTMWRAKGSPTLPVVFNEDDYPIAKAEAPTWGYTTLEMLQVWEAKIEAWSTASAAIESAERAALIAVAAAEDVAGIVGALAGLDFGV